MDAMAKGLISQEDNSDVQRILRSYFRQTEAPQVMHVEEALVAEGQAVLSLF
jgi:hypothetical protein